MLRNFAAALALTLLTQTAFALGLGTLKQSSALNEPFDGRIEILGAADHDIDTIVVKLADAKQFERAGVLRDAVLLQLKFTIVDGGSSPDYIEITSREPIREPFLNFLLEMNWANGRVVREYTALLDPPLYDPMKRQTARMQAPAPRVASPAPAPPPAPAVAPMSSPRPATASVAHAVAAPGGTIGPVQANDTLWSIASANRPDASVSMQQMMLALLRANPQAFGSDNINILKRGAILRLPDDAELHALSGPDAIEEVRRQHQLWTEYRGAATATVAEAPLGDEPAMDAAAETPVDTAPDAPAASTEPMDEVAPADSAETTTAAADVPATSDGHLELVAPDAGDDHAGAGTGDAGVSLAREALDAQVQENAELKARVDEANEIIDLMRRQVDIKDDELAALQARLQELDIEELGIEAPPGMVPGAEDDMSMPATVDGPTGPPVDKDHVVMMPDAGTGEVDISIGEPMPEGDAPADVSPDTPVSEADDAESGGLLPAHLTKMIPGGIVTVLAVIGALVLALIVGLVKLLGGRDEDDAVAHVATVTDDDLTAITEAVPEDDEPITENRDGEFEKTIQAEAYRDDDVPPEMQSTSPNLQRTIESTAAELMPRAEPDEDPLEEVNVYLAYERFDQAEELVRKVIGEHPNDHKYKLRLLEVFYSSNDKAAYENSARDLHAAVGADDALWESAVAMWTEMSPERALFEAGAVDDVRARPAGDAASAFVDITADADDASSRTMSMAPGSDALLETTQVGLGPRDDDEPSGTAGGLDFDLGADSNDLTGDAIFDLTTAPEGDDSDLLDLTGGDDADAIFDPSAPDARSATEDVFDISANSDAFSVGGADLLDITAPDTVGGLDLLDVTKTGNLGGEHPEDIMNVTSPRLLADDEPKLDDDEIVLSDDGASIDFDIGDTVSPLFASGAAAGTAADADEPLDFDIGGLGDDDVTTEFPAGSDTFDISGGLEVEAGALLDDGLDLNIPDSMQDSIDTVEMETASIAGEGKFETDTVPRGPRVKAEQEVSFDLSLQSSELDELSIGSDTVGEPQGLDADDEDSESEIEFDLALQDTTEMDALAIDDTLELPKTSGPDETLDDLAKSMEESMAELDLGDEEIDLGDATGELDLSLADTTGSLEFDLDTDSEGAPSLDFDIDDLDINELDPADTVAMDLSATIGNSTLNEQTVILPPSARGNEMQRDGDEVDTKLNLAKAYIELGDNDGARSILDEVVRDGSGAQQGEAQRLIDQIT